MKSLRKLSLAVTAVACVGLLGCGSGGDSAVAPALTPAPATTPSSAGPSPSTDPTPSTSPAPPAESSNAPAPSGGTVAPGTSAPTAPPAGPAAPPPANTTVAPPPPGAQPTQPGTAALPPVGTDANKALADAGPQGQAYLKALQAGGVPNNAAVNGLYVLLAQTTCQAKAQGEARDQILTQLSQIGPMLAPGSNLSGPQISELFVSSAEKYLC